jgi:hypothetical protein
LVLHSARHLNCFISADSAMALFADSCYCFCRQFVTVPARVPSNRRLMLTPLFLSFRPLSWHAHGGLLECSLAGAAVIAAIPCQFFSWSHRSCPRSTVTTPAGFGFPMDAHKAHWHLRSFRATRARLAGSLTPAICPLCGPPSPVSRSHICPYWSISSHIGNSCHFQYAQICAIRNRPILARIRNANTRPIWADMDKYAHAHICKYLAHIGAANTRPIRAQYAPF